MAIEVEPLTEEQQTAAREWYKNYVEHTVAYNSHLGLTVSAWETTGVAMDLPYADHLIAHQGILHGGVTASLIDAAGCAAVLAGHDFNLSARCSTVSLTINYLDVAPYEGLRVRAETIRRGRSLSSVDIRVHSLKSDKLLASAMMTVRMFGTRPEIDEVLGR